MCIFDVIIIVVAIASFLIGIRGGLIKELSDLLSVVVSIYGAYKFSDTVEKLFVANDINFQGLSIVCFIITFAAIALLLHFIASIISNAIGLSILSWPNKLLGGCFCVVKNMFIISCIISCINFFVGDVIDIFGENAKNESFTYSIITQIQTIFFPYLQDAISSMKA